MLNKNTWFSIVLFFFSTNLVLVYGQNEKPKEEDKEELIQFSGIMLTEEEGNLKPIEFGNIILTESGRGTYSNLDGFFSIVARKGDNVLFSALGYKTVEFVIPDTLTENFYSIYQMMSKDTIVLPTTIIYPIPDREHFKEEFLAMEVPRELELIADENLSPEKLERLREITERSGNETSAFYLRQQANKNYYYGQTPPQNIFSPLAWGKFIQAWKRGDFKRKSNE